MSAQFPAVIDSTMLNDFRQCPTKWAERYINCLATKGESVDLVFGGCFARGMEVTRKAYFRDKQSEADAISAGIQAAVRMWGDFEEPQGHHKSLTNLMLALHGYWEQWPLTQAPFPWNLDDTIEFSFAIPLDIKHPDTGADIIYGGRFDMLGSDGPMIYPVDEKTTGSPYFAKDQGWNLWGQFIGYVWACRQMGIDARQLLVRGIFVQKNQINYMQHITQVTDSVINRWLTDLYYTVKQMTQMYQEGWYPRVYGTACKVYRPCAYIPLCEATKREDWISWYQTVEQWNPLAKPGGEL